MFDNLLHQPVRSQLMATLLNNIGNQEALPFKMLKDTLGLTDGNLSSHLKKLDEAGYIKITKSFEGKRPKTTIAISEDGKMAFKEYIKQLQKFIEEN